MIDSGVRVEAQYPYLSASHLNFFWSLMEIWRAIPGYEGLYEVSSEGRVRSLGREQKNGVWRSGRVLRGCRNGLYWRVSLRDEEGVLASKNVHGLVLSAFVGPRPEGMECRHLNGDGLDNRLENLRWGSREENEMDKSSRRVLAGERHWGARLTADVARQIKYGPLSQRKTAKLFGVNQQYVSRIRSGERWAHV